MSLVERALRKLHAAQASGRTSSGAPPADDSPHPACYGAASELESMLASRAGRITLDRPALREAGLLPPESDERQIAQQYRRIKRPLIANVLQTDGVRREGARTIMVASALSGEGKTFTTLNLALSMARERDIHVLLVDADVAKPHLTRVFGLEKERGLLDVLRDPAPLQIESCIVGTDVPGLAFLPAGSYTEHATELLASSRMAEALEALAAYDRSRIVLLDSPPVLQTTEAHALAQSAGQVVLVVRAGATSRRDVTDALSYLQDRPSVGLVLNQAEADTPGHYYYGYYGYGDRGKESPPARPSDSMSARRR